MRWLSSPKGCHWYVPRTRGLLTEYEPPQPSLGNFTHLLECEGWEGDSRIETPPAYLAYHTGALASGHPLEGVRQSAEQALELLQADKLLKRIEERYPDRHRIQSNRDLGRYVQELKARHHHTTHYSH